MLAKDTHEAIISQELFEKANAVMDKRKAIYIKNTSKQAEKIETENILERLVFCADCNKPLMRHKVVYKSKKNAVWAYGCRTYKDQRMCSRKYVFEADIIGSVYEAIRIQLQIHLNANLIADKLMHETSYQSRFAHHDKEIEETEKELLRNISRRQSAYEDYAAKLIDSAEYKLAAEKYILESEKQHKRLEAAIYDKAKLSQNSTPATNRWLAAFTHVIDSKELTSAIAHTFIKRIEVSSNNKIVIIFKFCDESAYPNFI